MSSKQEIGGYAFIAGVVIAILAGAAAGLGRTGALGGAEGWIPLILVLLGVAVGFLNVKDKETTTFLIASIAVLTLAGSAGGLAIVDKVLSPLGSILVGIVQNLAVMIAPAALIVAVVTVRKLAAQQVNPL